MDELVAAGELEEELRARLAQVVDGVERGDAVQEGRTVEIEAVILPPEEIPY